MNPKPRVLKPERGRLSLPVESIGRGGSKLYAAVLGDLVTFMGRAEIRGKMGWINFHAHQTVKPSYGTGAIDALRFSGLSGQCQEAIVKIGQHIQYGVVSDGMLFLEYSYWYKVAFDSYQETFLFRVTPRALELLLGVGLTDWQVNNPVARIGLEDVLRLERRESKKKRRRVPCMGG